MKSESGIVEVAIIGWAFFSLVIGYMAGHYAKDKRIVVVDTSAVVTTTTTLPVLEVR